MLYVFLEGPDDERYFSSVYGERFRNLYGDYMAVEYAKMKQAKVNAFLRTIPNIPNAEYLFFGDGDGKTREEREEVLLKKYTSLSRERIAVVRYEIESWYYAGIDEAACKALKLKHYEQNTDNLTKEAFLSKFPGQADRIVIMWEILSRYSLSLAVERNGSLRDFDRSLPSCTGDAEER